MQARINKGLKNIFVHFPCWKTEQSPIFHARFIIRRDGWKQMLLQLFLPLMSKKIFLTEPYSRLCNPKASSLQEYILTYFSPGVCIHLKKLQASDFFRYFHIRLVHRPLYPQFTCSCCVQQQQQKQQEHVKQTSEEQQKQTSEYENNSQIGDNAPQFLHWTWWWRPWVSKLKVGMNTNHLWSPKPQTLRPLAEHWPFWCTTAVPLRCNRPQEWTCHTCQNNFVNAGTYSINNRIYVHSYSFKLFALMFTGMMLSLEFRRFTRLSISNHCIVEGA